MGTGAARARLFYLFAETGNPVQWEQHCSMSTKMFLAKPSFLPEASLIKEEERSELLNIFLSIYVWTRIYYGWRPNLPDETDNHLLELAVAGSARFIVTRNLHGLSRMDLTLFESDRVDARDISAGIEIMTALTVRLADDKYLRFQRARSTTQCQRQSVNG